MERRLVSMVLPDEYERDFLARMITRAFLAHDLCYGRSYGFAYGKAVLPRDR